jgi:hypothetical protein
MKPAKIRYKKNKILICGCGWGIWETRGIGGKNCQDLRPSWKSSGNR